MERGIVLKASFLYYMKGFLFSVFILTGVASRAQSDTVAQPTNNVKTDNWSAHFQFTAVSQSHSSFSAKYSGTNSLYSGVERGYLTITSTAFIGRKLWRYASIYANPEISGGQGLSGARGIAGFTNGESFRVGDPTPALYMGRYFLQQHFAVSNSSYDTLAEDANQVKEIVPSSRITLRAGKFSLSDFFDDNTYSHDPRQQFLNWSLMGEGAWDYPANTRGYTLGVMAEYVHPGYAARISFVQVPKRANGPWLNEKIGDVNGTTIEIEKSFLINKRKLRFSLLGFRNSVNAPLYSQTIKEMQSGDSSALAVITGEKYDNRYHHVKYGIGLNGEAEISDALGAFFRAGYNDGKSATWAYTEIDRSVSLGIIIKGKSWKRNEDVLGIAGVINGISKDHRDFLKAGGYGFIIGDGNLTYGSETIGEIFYNAKLFPHFYFSADYQFVSHPAYNKDRGPVSVFALRGHIEL